MDRYGLMRWAWTLSRQRLGAMSSHANVSTRPNVSTTLPGHSALLCSTCYATKAGSGAVILRDPSC